MSSKKSIISTYTRCVARMKDISALSSVAGLLAWDQETMMPRLASSARADQSAAIAGVIHEKFTAPEMGTMLKELAAHEDELSPGQCAVIRERLRDYDKSTKLPPKLVQELARCASYAQTEWIKAKKASDFKRFLPWLEKTVRLKRQQADAYGYDEHPYDPMLDDYEPHMTVRELDPVMEGLRRGLVPIFAAIHASSVVVRDDILTRNYPVAVQEEVGISLMKVMGIEMGANRLDRSAHPFCAGISSPVDVRITTHYDENNIHALFSILHESGHALYEQGLLQKHVGTPLAESVSLGIHESQSRFWENIVGRSWAFVRHLFPILQRHFPDTLAGIEAQTFYWAINKVRQSPIRIEADEVTYNLHVLLRYEIEKAFMQKDISARDLPGIWNEKMKAYLDISPANDAEGVLQDTHWASGLFGYFPTYSLGNLYAAQFNAKLRNDIRDVDDLIATGTFAPLKQWLATHIHRHGRRYSAVELVRRVTGRALSAEPFLAYLKTKYGEIYRIDTWS